MNDSLKEFTYEDLAAIKRRLLNGEPLEEVIDQAYGDRVVYLRIERDRLDGEKDLEGLYLQEEPALADQVRSPQRENPSWSLSVRRCRLDERYAFGHRVLQRLSGLVLAVPVDAEPDPALVPIRFGRSAHRGYLHPERGRMLLTQAFREFKPGQLIAFHEDRPGGQYGFIDHEGMVRIPAQFAEVGAFHEGLAPVKRGERWGYIDRTGGERIPCQYEAAGKYTDGIAPVRREGLWGAVDLDNRERLPFQFEVVGPIIGGLVQVIRDGRMGCMTIDGKTVVECGIIDQQVQLLSHSFNLWTVLQSGEDRLPVVRRLEKHFHDLHGFIDSQGNLAIPCQFEEAMPFSEGLACVGRGEREEERLYGFIDRDGHEVVPCRFMRAFSFSDGLALVKPDGSPDGKYGYIDSSGQLVIPCRYTTAHPFSEGRALVGQGGYPDKAPRRYAYINTRGQLETEFEFEQAERFSEGLAAARPPAGQWGYIGLDGWWAIAPRFDEAQPFTAGCAVVGFWNRSGSSPKRYGLIDREGRLRIEPRYERLISLQNGLVLAKQEATYGFLDRYGSVVIPFQFESVTIFHHGAVLVQENGLVRWLEGGLRTLQELTVADGAVSEQFAVLVIRPSSREEYTIDGFPTREAAIEFARRYTRDSLEESRQPGMTDRELREAWHLFGESACVIGGGYLGSQEIEFFIANPATAEERNWQVLQVPPSEGATR
ncbi:MAG: WG repeat-containing protein [Magnetococcus sp. YQC-3]